MEIRIIATANGEAPIWIRQAWVGCEMTAKPYCGSTKSVVTREPIASNVRGYAVLFEHAVSVLEKRNQKAAAWWHANEATNPRPNRLLIFSLEVCEPISLPELDIEQPPSHLAWG